jgi:hypothetical protein
MHGEVVDNKDPLRIGRVLWKREGVYEPHHPEWAIPLGWPGAGGVKWGSRYPVEIGAQIAVIFEHGDPDAPPGYLPACYGTEGGLPVWPALDKELVKEPQMGVTDADPLHVTVIWEDDTFRCFIVNQEDDKRIDKRLVLIEKRTNSGIILNARDGASKKAVTLTLAANTGINIRSNGLIDIQGATGVQIQGRKVIKKKGVTSI